MDVAVDQAGHQQGRSVEDMAVAHALGDVGGKLARRAIEHLHDPVALDDDGGRGDAAFGRVEQHPFALQHDQGQAIGRRGGRRRRLRRERGGREGGERQGEPGGDSDGAVHGGSALAADASEHSRLPGRRCVKLGPARQSSSTRGR